MFFFEGGLGFLPPPPPFLFLFFIFILKLPEIGLKTLNKLTFKNLGGGGGGEGISQGIPL